MNESLPQKVSIMPEYEVIGFFMCKKGGDEEGVDEVPMKRRRGLTKHTNPFSVSSLLDCHNSPVIKVLLSFYNKIIVWRG